MQHSSLINSTLKNQGKNTSSLLDLRQNLAKAKSCKLQGKTLERTSARLECIKL
jgi:hypothetical protein